MGDQHLLAGINQSCFVKFNNRAASIQIRRVYIDSHHPIAHPAHALSGIDEQRSCRNIGRQGNIMHVANPQQTLYIRIVRMFAQGIDKEKHSIHTTFGNHRRDLRISAVGSGQPAADFQSGLLVNKAASCLGCHQVKLRQSLPVVHHKGYHIGFLAIVRYESQGPPRRLLRHIIVHLLIHSRESFPYETIEIPCERHVQAAPESKAVDDNV